MNVQSNSFSFFEISTYDFIKKILSSYLFTGRVLTCYCEGQCPENAVEGECETRPGGSCFSSVGEVFDDTTGTYEVERTFGCMPPEHSGGLLQVKFP